MKWFGKLPESFDYKGYYVEWNEKAELYVIRNFYPTMTDAWCDTKIEAKNLIDDFG